MTIPAEGGEPKQLVVDSQINFGSPRWSPDGKWIAYDSDLPGNTDRGQSSVFVVRADGALNRRLGLGGMPTWAPDGKALAWHTYQTNGIVVADADGTGVEQIVSHWGNPCWSSDDRYILSLFGNDIASCDLHTGLEKVVFRPRSRPVYGWSLSPAGDRISYRTSDGLLIIGDLNSENGIERSRISQGIAEYSSWSPDGTRLVVSWQQPGSNVFQLYTLSVDGNDTPQILRGQEPNVSNLQPDWSPDGKTIVYRRAERLEE